MHFLVTLFVSFYLGSCVVLYKLVSCLLFFFCVAVIENKKSWFFVPIVVQICLVYFFFKFPERGGLWIEASCCCRFPLILAAARLTTWAWARRTSGGCSARSRPAPPGPAGRWRRPRGGGASWPGWGRRRGQRDRGNGSSDSGRSHWKRRYTGCFIKSAKKSWER